MYRPCINACIVCVSSQKGTEAPNFPEEDAVITRMHELQVDEEFKLWTAKDLKLKCKAGTKEMSDHDKQILKKKTQKPHERSAQREAALREVKERNKAKKTVNKNQGGGKGKAFAKTKGFGKGATGGKKL